MSLTGGNRGGGAGIAVLKRLHGNIELSHVVPLKSAPTGITLTHDGKLLIAAATNATVFLDVPRMVEGGAAGPVLGSFSDGRLAGSIYANVTSDDKVLFVSEEYAASITVIDLDRARTQGYSEKAILGKIPTGNAPIALTFSPDGKWLYTTSQGALPDWNWPKACKPEGSGVPDSIITNPQGAVVVIDVARARTDPAHSVVARVPAGCSPVRMAISPAGDRIYVTARNNNAVLAFDTAKLLSGAGDAQVGIAPVGDAPVPIAVVDRGTKLVTGNSNRFAAGNSPESLVVLDAARMDEGIGAVLGVVPAGAFPREMRVSEDGRTLFLTNFGSRSLQVLDIARLPIDPHLPAEVTANAAALAHRNDRKEITVDGKLLNAYAGAYRIPDGRVVLIEVKGDRLTARIGTQPAMNLLPESGVRFFLRPGMEFEFPALAPGQDHTDRVVLHRFGNDATASRLDAAAAKPFRDAAAAFDERFKAQAPAPGGEAAVRQIIAGLQAGKADESIMSSGALSSQTIQELRAQVAKLAAIQSIAFKSVGPGGADIYSIKSDKGSWEFRIWLNPDGKVEQALLSPFQPRQ